MRDTAERDLDRRIASALDHLRAARAELWGACGLEQEMTVFLALRKCEKRLVARSERGKATKEAN